MKGSATVQIRKGYKWGEDKFFVYIPKHIVTGEGLNSGTVVGLDIENTGQTFKRAKLPYKKNLVKKPDNFAQVDELKKMMDQIRTAKKSGLALNQLKDLVNNHPDYVWEDFPKDFRKEIEKF